jgi:hypothetical protein
VLDAAQPKSASAAQAAALALGKRLLTFGSQAEFDAVRAAITSSYAFELLSSGALAGLWVDAAGSAYLPPGYSLPASGQASLLAGASLALSNVPVATTVAGTVLEKCAEVDSSIGEGWVEGMLQGSPSGSASSPAHVPCLVRVHAGCGAPCTYETAMWVIVIWHPRLQL